MITAAQARELAGPTIEERIEDVGKAIEIVAKKNDRNLALHDDFWVNGGYSKTPEWTKAKEMLEAKGFKVSFFYEERQFVNMFTLVEW